MMNEKDWERWERDVPKRAAERRAEEQRKRLAEARSLGSGRGGGMSEETGKTVAIVGVGVAGVAVGYLLLRAAFGDSEPPASARATVTNRNATAEAPAAPAAPAASGGTLTVTIRPPLNVPGSLRASASVKSKRTGYVNKGTAVSVLESATGDDGHTWYRVRTPSGGVGWMSGDILA